MTDKKFGWCFIGTGSITESVMRDMPYTKGSWPAAVYSRNYGHAQSFAEKHGCRAYRTAQEAMEDPDVRAVYVATPHTGHAEFTLKALDRGLPVLCEKPVSTDYAQAKEMFDAARKNGTYLMEAMWTCHNPVLQRALDWVREGKIGKPRAVSAAFSFFHPFDPASRLFDPELGGGALLDVGVYVLALTRFIFGAAPDEMIASGSLAPNGVDLLCSMTGRYADGAAANLFIGFGADSPQDAWIGGEKGYIAIPAFWKAKSALLHTADGEETCAPGFPGSGYQFEFDAVMEDVLSGKKENDVLTPDFSLSVMKAVDAVMEQLTRH